MQEDIEESNSINNKETDSKNWKLFSLDLDLMFVAT
jgi:hypothetical protein